MSLSDRITVRRKNVFLTVPADEADRYLAKGYDIVDRQGNIVRACTPNDVDSLRAAYDQSLKRIKELEAEIAELKAQPTESKATKPATSAATKKSSKK